MARTELDKSIRKIVGGLKVEHYDLLHKHGYADFRLDEPEAHEGYEEDEKWLSEVYEKALGDLIQDQINKAMWRLIAKQQEGNFKGTLLQAVTSGYIHQEIKEVKNGD